MKKRNGTRIDVLRAIEDGRLRVDVKTGTAEIRRGVGPRASWRAPKLEMVRAPHQRLPYARLHFGAGCRALLHRVVWWAAGRTIPNGLELNHKNGDKLDCSLANLELVTSASNQEHAYETGLKVNLGTKNLFDGEEVRTLRRLRAQGFTLPELVEHVRGRTDASTISKIVRGVTYSHVK